MRGFEPGVIIPLALLILITAAAVFFIIRYAVKSAIKSEINTQTEKPHNP